VIGTKLCKKRIFSLAEGKNARLEARAEEQKAFGAD
jgi:hypothetical protein